MRNDPVARITGKHTGRREAEEEDLIRIHHEIMKTYGWISFEEFKRLPLPTFFNLWECIVRDREQEQKEYDKAKSRRR